MLFQKLTVHLNKINFFPWNKQPKERSLQHHYGTTIESGRDQQQVIMKEWPNTLGTI